MEESSEFVTEETETALERRIRSEGWQDVVFTVGEEEETDRAPPATRPDPDHSLLSATAADAP